jgi:GH15 family glucan-1,4-alpha-glucosidase
VASLIEDYAVIGDCETAALVAKDGSIDWLCWPAFSSSACFAALLGDDTNGCWRMAPAAAGSKVSRKYRDHTLILETTFEAEDGSFTLIDFMPVRGRHSDIVRIVRGVSGRPAIRMELALRFDYGRAVPWVSRIDGGLLAIAGPDMAVFRTSVEHRGEEMKTVADFTVGEGESVSFVLTYGVSYEPPPRAIDPEKALEDTARFWRHWSARYKGTGGYAGAVQRSLITLKALTYRPHWRYRRGGNDLTARGTRRRTQLGLSILLVARCHLYAAGVHEQRLLRRSEGVARLAAPGDRWQS